MWCSCATTNTTAPPTCTIAVPAAAWALFLESALSAEVQGGSIAVPGIVSTADGVIVRDTVGTVLEFTSTEWTAFVASIRAGEFTLVSV